jgi:hypothetical protein
MADELARYETMAEALLEAYRTGTTEAMERHYFNSYTTITDRTPELLAGMESLERVTVDGYHNLTNAGIARLARLPRLRELRASGRQITPDVVDAFARGVNVFVA